MSTGSSQQAKEQVKSAIDIVDLVGSYLPLRREGRAFKALCPWHDDTRPSLTINPERQSFRCWVCNIGGDVFSFLMRMEGITFPEALEMLAERAGISLQRGRPGEADAADAKRFLFRAMAWVEEQYHHCLLRAPEAEPARRYLADRGLSPQSSERHHLGFAPSNWQWLVERAAGTDFKPQVLEKVGVLGQRRENRGYYDRFRGRVLFPIHDPQGRSVGLGGRVLPGNDDPRAAKYINSPETPLFAKHKLLYGLDVAKDAISRSRTVIVTEGYTDCLMAWQHGFENVVAALGTALGIGHLHTLRPYADRIVLVLDGDAAGQRRADEILELFITEPVDLRILTLPDSLDPCDFLLSRGAEAFSVQIDKAVDALEHRFRTATGGLGGTGAGLHESNRALEDVLGTLAKAPRLRQNATRAARLMEEQILHRLALQFGIAEVRLRDRLTEIRRSVRAPSVSSQATPAAVHDPLDPLERELVEHLLQFPHNAERLRQVVALEDVKSVPCRRVLQACFAASDDAQAPDYDRLSLALDDPLDQGLLVELDETARAKRAAGGEYPLDDLIAAFERRRDRRLHEQERQTLAAGEVDEATKLDLLQRFLERQRQRQRKRPGISEPTEG